MSTQNHAENAKRGALRWGLPMFGVLGTVLYFRTRSLVNQGSPEETLRLFWWPFAPVFLFSCLLLGALFGVVVHVVIQLISSRGPSGG